MPAVVIPDWREKVVYASDGPKPLFLAESDQIKFVLAGLEAGQKIPVHPDTLAMYHFLDGSGWMVVDGERIAVGAGTTVVAPDGAARGMEAETRLAFIASRVA
ncbi:MAG: hypothetical protein R3E39_17490 [Anaerolineae bacterium]